MVSRIMQVIADQFNTGGPFMWVILAVLAVATAVVIERLLYYFLYCRADALSLAVKMSQSLRSGAVEEARVALGKRTAPLFVLLRTALDRYANGVKVEKVEQSIEEAAIREMPRMSKRLNYLSLFANIATLLGLLGTITGLQVSFSSLSTVDAAQKAAMLASGISQAMNTTAFGLIVAVPCMVMYTILSNKHQALVKEMDEAVVRVVNSMRPE